MHASCMHACCVSYLESSRPRWASLFGTAADVYSSSKVRSSSIGLGVVRDAALHRWLLLTAATAAAATVAAAAATTTAAAATGAATGAATLLSRMSPRWWVAIVSYINRARTCTMRVCDRWQYVNNRSRSHVSVITCCRLMWHCFCYYYDYYCDSYSFSYNTMYR